VESELPRIDQLDVQPADYRRLPGGVIDAHEVALVAERNPQIPQMGQDSVAFGIDRGCSGADAFRGFLPRID